MKTSICGIIAGTSFLLIQSLAAQTTDYLPKYVTSTTFTNSPLASNSANTSVGIGTASPATLLHIIGNSTNGPSSSYLNMRLEKNLGALNTQNNYADFLFTSNPGGAGFTAGNGSFSIRMNNTWGTSDMIFMQNPTTLGFILKSSGNFGIATVSPGERFQVDGGNALVRGANNFAATGNTASMLLGSSSYSVFAKKGTGISIATPNYTNGLLHVFESGKVAIGDGSSFTNLPGTYKLYVDDGILTEKVRVAVYGSASWADYVFAPGYHLRPLGEVEQFIKANKHLPEVPSAEQVAKEGIDVAAIDATLLKKVEELTLYIIEQEKRISEQNKRIEQLEEKSGNH